MYKFNWFCGEQCRMGINMVQQCLGALIHRLWINMVSAGVVSWLEPGVEQVQVAPEVVLLAQHVDPLQELDSIPVVDACTAFQAGTKGRGGVCHNGWADDLMPVTE